MLALVVASSSLTIAIGGPSSWSSTLDRVTPAVVSIRMDRPRAFEGKGRSNSYATGFVIDAERGLILSNRHVVTAGPTVAKAVFLNHEEVPLIPLYRDPVHDFGLFRYDPEALRFIDPQALRLRPDKARVGTEIRVVGNDAGEQISILDGTLARLDRAAPSYGSDFNDFNTFYIQAATSTSGGSSGSPVIDLDGDVLALNAGSKNQAASAFYLPLDRVVRAVELLVADAPVPRGTLQARWSYTHYDQLRRLGLSQAAEEAARAQAPDGSGLLVLRELLPGGPVHTQLQIGDILLSAGGEPVHDFVTLEAQLDDRVGERLPIVVERAGEPVSIEATVGDLHALVPASYLEVGGAVLHDLSYHQARVMQVPVRGVYVADKGFAFDRDGIPSKAILIEADGVPLPDLDALVSHLSGVGDGTPVRFRWYAQGAPQQLNQTAVRMDRRWFSARRCVRDDADGSWPCQDLPLAEPRPPEAPPNASLPPSDDRRGRRLASSLVQVECDLPYQIAGVPNNNYVGAGLVIDAARGWVLVDRDTLPTALADVTITVAGTVRIPARVVALHPLHDLAIVAYDPAAVPAIGLTSAQLRTEPVEAGDKAWSVTLERDTTIEVRSAEIFGPEPIYLKRDGAPRFREHNLEPISIDPRPSRNGVLVDRAGEVLGFHASMSYTSGRDTKSVMRTIPAQIVADLVALAQGVAALHGLGWELRVLPLPEALQLGLPAAWAERLLAHDPERRGVLQVVRTVQGSGVADVAQGGDLVLSVDGSPVSRFGELERAALSQEEVLLKLIRDGQIVDEVARTEALSPIDVDRVVLWSGLRIHAPHRAARLSGADPHRPYISWWNGGSPAGRAGVYPRRFVRQIAGTDTPDLATRVEVIDALPEGAPVRLVIEDLAGERSVLTIEPNEDFWPTAELVWEEGRWIRRAL